MSLEARNISFSYGEKKILSDISFSVEQGEILCLLGPNGTGKTTLLKCINHILKPEAGESFVDGISVKKMKPRQRAESMGYVPQSTAAPFPVTVVDAVMMGRAPFARRRIGEEDKRIVFDTIRMLDLERFAFQDLNEMSGGERQRVFLARALVQQPRVLLLDEPTSALDMRNQLFIMHLIKDLVKQQNLAVLMTIHDLNLTAMFADQVIMLKGSRIFASGSCKEVIGEENIRGAYRVNTEVTEKEDTCYVRLRKALPEDEFGPESDPEQGTLGQD